MKVKFRKFGMLRDENDLKSCWEIPKVKSGLIVPNAACFSYFIVSMIKHHGPEQLKEERTYFDLWFQRDKSP